MTDIKARTTMYKGTKMRSRLEADFAAFLDRAGAEWEYEPVCFAGPEGQWLPDFRVRWDNGNLVYFEVKPESFPDDDIDPALERMSVAWLTDPTAVLQLVLWTFGEPLRSSNYMGIPAERDGDLTWWFSEGDGDLYAWPGMGQLRHFVEMASQEAEQSS